MVQNNKASLFFCSFLSMKRHVSEFWETALVEICSSPSFYAFRPSCPLLSGAPNLLAQEVTLNLHDRLLHCQQMVASIIYCWAVSCLVAVFNDSMKYKKGRAVLNGSAQCPTQI